LAIEQGTAVGKAEGGRDKKTVGGEEALLSERRTRRKRWKVFMRVR